MAEVEAEIHRELECGYCGRRFEEPENEEDKERCCSEDRYQIVHVGSMFYEVVDVCKECKLENIEEEIKGLSLCSGCNNDDCPSVLERVFEGTELLVLVTKCEFFKE